MTFKEWLSKIEATRDPTGDLIGDLKADDELPDVESKEELLAYMKKCGACTAALKAVPVVWKRFRRWGGAS
jgi:hypothetical protein